MEEIIKNAVEMKDGKAVTTSLKIAEVFGKQHKDVLKAIRELDCPKDFRERNFAPSSATQKMPNGGTKNIPMYIVTRDGFTLLAMGFTGKAAMQFKIAYIEAFNAMERTIKGAAAGNLPSSEVMMATLYNEMERRFKAESERDEYRRNLQRIALVSGLDFGEISENTGLPKDIVIPTYCRSSKREHAPQAARYIQLILPLREIVAEYRSQLGDAM